MIWDILQQSSFNNHFTNPQLTITTLLLDENIITQLKNQNPQLLQYLNINKHQFIKSMIDYVITMPSQSDTYDRCYRLPYISSELLALNSDLIYSQFFKSQVKEEDNEYWSQFIEFLDDKTAHNQILTGYFEKVINNLYNGNKTKTCRIVSIHLPKFISLISNGSIGDILKNCIILLTIADGEVVTQRLLILESIIEQLVNGDEEVKKICTHIIIDIINKFQTYSSGQLIISNLLNHQTFLKIYSIQKSMAINQLLIGMITKSQQTSVNQHDQVIKILNIPTIHNELLIDYLKVQARNLQQYAKSEEYIRNQTKKVVRKSHKQIYSILNLINLAIESISVEFLSYELIKTLWSLLGLYPFNNILQVIILKIFMNILKQPNSKTQHFILNHYESYILQLVQINLQMFRPLIFKLWNEAKKFQTVTTDKDILLRFQSFVDQHLQNLMKYVIDKTNIQHSERKTTKLVVDQQDNLKQPQVFTIEKQQIIQIIPYKFQDETFNQHLKQLNSNSFSSFNFDQFKNMAQQSSKNEKSDNPFGTFDSFF